MIKSYLPLEGNSCHVSCFVDGDYYCCKKDLRSDKWEFEVKLYYKGYQISYTSHSKWANHGTGRYKELKTCIRKMETVLTIEGKGFMLPRIHGVKIDDSEGQ